MIKFITIKSFVVNLMFLMETLSNQILVIAAWPWPPHVHADMPK